MPSSSSAGLWRLNSNASEPPAYDDIDHQPATSSGSPAGSSKQGSKKKGSNDFPLEERHAKASGSDDAQQQQQQQQPVEEAPAEEEPVVYRTYKRRWFGLAQLTLMNIMVSWGWLTYAPVASNAAAYYSVSESAINWLSTAFFLSFVVVAPLVLLTLHHPSGLRLSLSIAAFLLLLGNWIRFAGATHRSDRGGTADGKNGYAFAMAGEILIGFAQPFVLAAPTRYSDLWFTNRGRVAATAVMSLANPFGAALGQLINPLFVSESRDISDMVLVVSIISTVAAVPSFAIPSKPPTPVSASTTTPKLRLKSALPALRSLELWLIILPFWVYVGFFNSLSSLLNQVLTPYGYTDDEAGIAGAVLIVVGLVVAGASAPVIDRTKKFLLAIKIFVPLTALSFFVFIWMPETESLPGPYLVLALLGASAFSLMPVALECLIELSHPLNPAVTSVFAWSGGQLFGAIFVLVSDALVASEEANPPKNMKNALIFQAVLAVAVAPLPMVLGMFGREKMVELRRVKSDEGAGAHHQQNA